MFNRKHNIRIIPVALALSLLIGCAATPTQESSGQYIDDSAITTKVKAALLRDPQVSGLAINVDTFKGTVQLSGFANSELERRQAAALAKSVEGVTAVQNRISLK